MKKYFKVKENTEIMKNNNYYFDNINNFKKETNEKMSELLGIEMGILNKKGLASKNLLIYGVTEKTYDLMENKDIFKKNKSYVGDILVYEFKSGSKLYKDYVNFCKSHENFEKLEDAVNSLLFWTFGGKSSRVSFKNLILLTSDGIIEESFKTSFEEIKAGEYYELKEEKEDEIKKLKENK